MSYIFPSDNARSCDSELNEACERIEELEDQLASRQALNGEATGTLTVDHHKNDPTMQNVDYEHADGVLEPGVYKLYTHPTSAEVPEKWRTVMKELADDLESEIEARRSGDLDRRIERDLIVVREARALLAEQEQGHE